MVALNTPVCDFGWKAPSFQLHATDGQSYSLQDVAGPRGTLIMFICNHCPFVKSIATRLSAEARQLQEMGIGVAAICSNASEDYAEDSFEKMIEYGRLWDFSFPYLHDKEQIVGRTYGAICTPDFFGFNAGLELQYRGRFDDAGMKAIDPDSERELLNAMRQIAETGNGPKEQKPSIGCSIKWRQGG